MPIYVSAMETHRDEMNHSSVTAAQSHSTMENNVAVVGQKLNASENSAVVKKRKPSYLTSKLPNGMMQYKCTVCGEMFSSEGDMVSHKETHILQESESIISAQSPNGKMTNSSSKQSQQDGSKSEIGSVHQEFSLDLDQPTLSLHVCQDCKVAFRSKALLTEHRETAHQVAPYFVCEICELSFKLKELCQLHKTITHFGLCAHCPACAEIFDDEPLFTWHWETDHSQENLQDTLSNPEVDTDMGNPDSYGDAQEQIQIDSDQEQCTMETEENVKVHKCSMCSKRYESKASLLRHQRMKHKSSEAAAAEVPESSNCSLGTDSTQQTSEEIVIDEDISYTTDSEKNRFSINTVTTDCHSSGIASIDADSCLTCAKCDATFSKKEDLNKHILKLHFSQNFSKCRLSTKAFASKVNCTKVLPGNANCEEGSGNVLLTETQKDMCERLQGQGETCISVQGQVEGCMVVNCEMYPNIECQNQSGASEHCDPKSSSGMQSENLNCQRVIGQLIYSDTEPNEPKSPSEEWPTVHVKLEDDDDLPQQSENSIQSAPQVFSGVNVKSENIFEIVSNPVAVESGSSTEEGQQGNHLRLIGEIVCKTEEAQPVSPSKASPDCLQDQKNNCDKADYQLRPCLVELERIQVEDSVESKGQSDVHFELESVSTVKKVHKSKCHGANFKLKPCKVVLRKLPQVESSNTVQKVKRFKGVASFPADHQRSNRTSRSQSESPPPLYRIGRGSPSVEADESDDDDSQDQIQIDSEQEQSDMETEEEVKVHKCSTCSKRYESKASLLRHQRMKHKSLPYECTLCGQSFAGKVGLNIHRNSAHIFSDLQDAPTSSKAAPVSDRPAQDCSTSTETTGSKSKKLRLEVDSPNHEPQDCSAASENVPAKFKKLQPEDKSSSKTITSGSQTINKNESNTKNSYECQTCHKSFMYQFQFLQHRPCMHKRHKCRVCNETFALQTKCDEHYKSVHLGSQVGQPQECQTTTDSETIASKSKKQIPVNYSLSINTITPEGQSNSKTESNTLAKNSYECQTCHKSFLYKFQFLQHRPCMHERIKCPVCDETFALQTKCDEHHKSVHLGSLNGESQDSPTHHKSVTLENQQTQGSSETVACKSKKLQPGDNSSPSKTITLASQTSNKNKTDPLVKNTHKCQTCGKSFAHEFQFLQHRPCMHQMHKCPGCPKTFQFKMACDRHYKSVHLEPQTPNSVDTSEFECSNHTNLQSSDVINVQGSNVRHINTSDKRASSVADKLASNADKIRINTGTTQKAQCSRAEEKLSKQVETDGPKTIRKPEKLPGLVYSNTIKKVQKDKCIRANFKLKNCQVVLHKLQDPAQADGPNTGVTENVQYSRIEKNTLKQAESNRPSSKTVRTPQKALGDNSNVEINETTDGTLEIQSSNEVSQKKEFICQLCDGPFAEEKDFFTHDCLILKEYPECPVCEKKFTNVPRHYRSVHLGYKPFECGECDAAFSDKRNLIKHQQKAHKGRLQTENAVASESSKASSTNSTNVASISKRRRKESDDMKSNQDDSDCTSVTSESVQNVKDITHNEKSTKSSPKDSLHRCPICSKGFKLRFHIVRHFETAHVEHQPADKTPTPSQDKEASIKINPPTTSQRKRPSTDTTGPKPSQSKQPSMKAHKGRSQLENAVASESSKASSTNLTNIASTSKRRRKESDDMKSNQDDSDCTSGTSESVQNVKEVLSNVKDITHNEKSTKSTPKDSLFRCPICSKGFKMRFHIVRHFETAHVQHQSADKTPTPSQDKEASIKINPPTTSQHKQPSTDTNGPKPSQSKQPSVKPNRSTPSTNTQESAPMAQTSLDVNEEDNKKVHKKTLLPCKMCSKSFSNKAALIQHQQKRHNKVRPYRCPVCLKGFFKQENCERHYRTTHSQLKRCTCETCGDEFQKTPGQKTLQCASCSVIADKQAGTKTSIQIGTAASIQAAKETEPGIQTGKKTEPGTKTGAETGKQTGTKSSTQTGTETGNKTGTGPEQTRAPDKQTGAETGKKTGSETGNQTGADPGNKAGTKAGSQKETETQAGTETAMETNKPEAGGKSSNSVTKSAKSADKAAQSQTKLGSHKGHAKPTTHTCPVCNKSFYSEANCKRHQKTIHKKKMSNQKQTSDALKDHHTDLPTNNEQISPNKRTNKSNESMNNHPGEKSTEKELDGNSGQDEPDCDSITNQLEEKSTPNKKDTNHGRCSQNESEHVTSGRSHQANAVIQKSSTKCDADSGHHQGPKKVALKLKLYICTICKQTFNNLESLTRHQLRHLCSEDEDNAEISPDVCHEPVTSSIDTNNVVSRDDEEVASSAVSSSICDTNMDIKGVETPQCERTQTSRAAKSSFRYDCASCKESFDSSLSLIMHIKGHMIK